MNAAIAAPARHWLLMCALGVVVLVPTSASAAPSPVQADFGTLFVSVNAGDTTPHDISVSYSGTVYVVTDPAGAAPVGPGCTSLGAGAVSCPEPGINNIAVTGGEGDDRITVASVGPGVAANPLGSVVASFSLGGNDVITTPGTRDVLSGGDGKDVVNAGAGDDRLSGDAGKDKLTGGPGSDRCRGGKGKDKAASCEKEIGIP